MSHVAGHAEHHAILKADYDARHSDAPLPAFEHGAHLEIHRLLALGYNVGLGANHIEGHNLLAAACNGAT